MATNISQLIVQVEVSATSLGLTKITQALAQVEVSATTLGWTKISQEIIQVEVDPPKSFSDTIGFDDSISGYIETQRAISGEVIGFSDSFTGFRYTNYQNTIDNPHVGPVRIAKIELPGKTLYLCDRIWGET